MADHTMIGKSGRVTGPIVPGKMGEVMVRVRGGVEAFNAYLADGDEPIPTGCQVAIVDYWPPRTVLVSRL